jgi:endonuclease YncB( thermonuclease family)
MYIHRPHLFLWILFLSGCSTRLPHENSEVDSLAVEFVRNYDGDTLTVNIPALPQLFGKNMPVRIKGIDTAEIRARNKCEKEAAIKAKDFVHKKLSEAESIRLIEAERDKYFRILAEIEFDGVLLGELLLNSSLAVVYHGEKKQDVDWCALVSAPTKTQ